MITIDGEVMVTHFKAYGRRVTSTDGKTSDIWYDERDDAVIERDLYGGSLIVRDGWMSEAREPTELEASSG